MGYGILLKLHTRPVAHEHVSSAARAAPNCTLGDNMADDARIPPACATFVD